MADHISEQLFRLLYLKSHSYDLFNVLLHNRKYIQIIVY